MAAIISNLLANYDPDAYQRRQTENDLKRAQIGQVQATAAQTGLVNQRLERELRDQQIIAQAWKNALDASGNVDPNRLAIGVIQGGGSPGAVMPILQQMTEYRKNNALAEKDILDAQQKRHDQLRGILSSIPRNADPDTAQRLWDEAMPRIKPLLDPNETLPAAYPGADAVQRIANSHALQSALIDEQLKKQQIAASEGSQKKTEQETAAARRKEGLQALAAIVDPATGLPADAAQYALVRQKYPELNAPEMPSKAWNELTFRAELPPDKWAEYDATRRMAAMTPEQWKARVDAVVPPAGVKIGDQIYDTSALNARTWGLVQGYIQRGDWKGADTAIKDASDQIGRTETGVRTAKATAPIKVMVAGQEAAARTPQLSDNALDLMAEDALNGKMPSSRNPILYARVMNRAAELAKERGMTAQGALLARNAAAANRTALNAVTKQYEVLKPFGEMAEKNADLLEKKLAEVSDLGGSLLNTPVRELESKFGSAKVAALKAALLPVQADFARILNSPTGSGVLSDDARHEMQQAIKPGATVAEMRAALGVFRQDWQNRKQTYESQIQDLTGRSVAGGTGAGTAAGQPGTQTGADAAQYVRKAQTKDGHIIGQKSDGGWYDVQTGQKVQ